MFEVKKKYCIVFGTRPEIIKMSPVIRFLKKRNADFVVVHTGQHYSHEMDKIFMQELELPPVDYNLEVGSGSHGEQTGSILMRVESILSRENPDVVLVQGDTNSVLAGALAATKLHLKVGHIEAGLRSFDRLMPEEVNRVVVDHVSDYLFVPTDVSHKNLRNEGIDRDKVHVVGNTVVDAISQNYKIARKRSRVLKNFGIRTGSYFLQTLHRSENVDSQDRMEELFLALEQVVREYSDPFVYPIHPRSYKNLDRFGLLKKFLGLKNFRLVKPVGYFDFLKLTAHAKIILTDSGGVQEEACILKVPCLTLRENTERPETVTVGANQIVGVDRSRILAGIRNVLQDERDWSSVFGDGKSAEQIIRICEEG